VHGFGNPLPSYSTDATPPGKDSPAKRGMKLSSMVMCAAEQKTILIEGTMVDK
jgi:hypothetical protein